jgi:hypothetical protein
VAGLAGTFNAMLAHLEQSFDAQRWLLADTSHERLPHVFDHFYRADPARSRSAAGETV